MTTLPRLAALGFALLAPVVVVAGSTEGADRAVPLVTVARFVEDDPRWLFNPASLVASATVFSGLATPGWSWEVVSGELVGTPAAMTVDAPRGRAELRLARALEATDMARLEIEIEPPSGGVRAVPLSLSWRSSGRAVAPLLARLDRASQWRLVLDLSGAAEWRGSLSELRLELVVPSRVRLRFRRFEGCVEALAGDRVKELVATGTKLELDREVRTVLPGFPGIPVERWVDVPRAARLHFSWGAQPRVELPLRLVAAATSESGQREQLFEHTVADPSELGRWFDEELSLAALAGRRVLLELSVEADAERDPRAGIVVWGSPEVLAPAVTAPPPNLVVICLDTLRADRLSLYGYERTTTPHLDAWARASGVVFATTVAPANWTYPSHVSLFTGLDAYRISTLQLDSMVSPVPLLSERFRQAGYATLAVTGGGILRPARGFIQGFDRYRSNPQPRSPGEESEIERGVDDALRWLDEFEDRPFLLFFHSYEVHTPYEAREPYFSSFYSQPSRPLKLTQEQPSEGNGYRKSAGLCADCGPLLGALYDSGVAFADRQVARLLDRLKRSGLDHNTIVVVTSDHGELLGEHQVTGHFYLHDENLLVPLVIATPSRRGAGRVVGDQVRLVDLLPTVLELAGLDAAEGIDGSSLVPLMDGGEGQARPPVLSYAGDTNHGLSVRLADGRKYVLNNTVWPPVRGVETVVASGADGERPHAAEEVVAVDSLRQVARRALTESPGLRLAVRTDHQTALSGSLRSALLAVNRVKSTDLSCDCLQWTEEATRLEVPPGSSFTVTVEGHRPQGVVLSLRGGGAGIEEATFELATEPTELVRGLTVVLDRDGWHAGSARAGDTARAVLELWWVGPSQVADDNPTPALADADDSQVEQLRVLGYVE